MKQKELITSIRKIISYFGDNPDRTGLLRTPERYIKVLERLTIGNRDKEDEIFKGALFDAPHTDMVIIKDIELYSLCEHHLLPFYGKCHVGYLPKKHIIGLSKIARIVEHFARRFQVQERLTFQIADCIHTHLKPLGVGVVIEAYHLCMMMRGVEKQNAMAKTSSLLGAFRRPETRAEFFNLIK